MSLPITSTQKTWRIAAQRRSHQNRRTRDTRLRDAAREEQVAATDTNDQLDLTTNSVHFENRSPSSLYSCPISTPETNCSPISSSGISNSSVPPDQIHYSPLKHFYCSDFRFSPILSEEPNFRAASPAYSFTSSVEKVEKFLRNTSYSHPFG